MQVTTTTKTSAGVKAVLLVGTLMLSVGLGAVVAAIFSFKSVSKITCLPCVEQKVSILSSKKVLSLSNLGNITTLWSQTYGDVLYDEAKAVALVEESGYIAAGHAVSPYSGIRHGALIRVDAQGNLSWARTYGQDDVINFFNDVIVTSQGYYLAVGQESSQAKPNIYVVRTNNSGEVEWEKKIGGSYTEVGNKVIENSSGQYIISGYAYNGSNGLDGYVVALDEDGNNLWSKYYGTLEYYEEFDTVVSANDGSSAGGYLLAGERVVSSEKNYDAWLVRIDSTGTEMWSQTFGSEKEEHISDVINTTDNGYLLVGWVNSFTPNTYDYYVAKVDGGGNLLWSKEYDAKGYDDEAMSVQQAADGGYLVVGRASETVENVRDVYLLKIDAEGNKQWDQFFGGPENDDREDQGYDIQKTTGGNYIIAGFSQSYGTPADSSTDYKEPDIWLIKFRLNPESKF